MPRSRTLHERIECKPRYGEARNSSLEQTRATASLRKRDSTSFNISTTRLAIARALYPSPSAPSAQPPSDPVDSGRGVCSLLDRANGQNPGAWTSRSARRR